MVWHTSQYIAQQSMSFMRLSEYRKAVSVSNAVNNKSGYFSSRECVSLEAEFK